MPHNRDDMEFEEQWGHFVQNNNGRAFGSEGIAATCVLECASGRHFGVKLIITDGLYMALARTPRELLEAGRELAAAMPKNDDETSGIVVLSQELASQTFGPVPQELIDRGISWHPSAEGQVIDGAVAFIREYFDIRDMTREGLVEAAG